MHTSASMARCALCLGLHVCKAQEDKSLVTIHMQGTGLRARLSHTKLTAPSDGSVRFPRFPTQMLDWRQCMAWQATGFSRLRSGVHLRVDLMDQLVGQHEVGNGVGVGGHAEVLIVAAREAHVDAVVLVQHAGHAIKAKAIKSAYGPTMSVRGSSCDTVCRAWSDGCVLCNVRPSVGDHDAIPVFWSAAVVP